MKENNENYKIIVDNVYKTFNVYLDKANTLKEKYYSYLVETEKKKRSLKRHKLKNKRRRSCSPNWNKWKWQINITKIND